MKKSWFTLEHTRQLTADTYEVVLSGDTSAITAPGQFVNLELPGKFPPPPHLHLQLDRRRRPDAAGESGGRGHPGAGALRARHGAGRALPGLGNGFDLSKTGAHPVLAGGGIGIAPLYGLARRMLDTGVTPTVALGFRTAKDAFYLEEFAALGCSLSVATEDGSLGTRGFVTDCIRALPECDYVYTCGPLPMLKAVHQLPQLTGGQFSFEARMGCGFGACMGCTVPTVDGYKRVCKDGPILYKEEIVW